MDRVLIAVLPWFFKWRGKLQRFHTRNIVHVKRVVICLYPAAGDRRPFKAETSVVTGSTVVGVVNREFCSWGGDIFVEIQEGVHN